MKSLISDTKNIEEIMKSENEIRKEKLKIPETKKEKSKRIVFGVISLIIGIFIFLFTYIFVPNAFEIYLASLLFIVGGIASIASRSAIVI